MPFLTVDPLADLLFSLVAIVILAVIVLIPAILSHPLQALPGVPQKPAFRLNGQEVEPWIAAKQGLLIGPAHRDLVPYDRILDDNQLAAKLERLRAAGERLLLIIEPDGLETAFLFESALSLHGPRTIHQIRLDSACRSPRSRRAKVCASLRVDERGRP
jgi:hypothetical protein